MSELTMIAPMAASIRLRHTGRALVAAAALVAAGDQLLFRHAPGLSLAMLVVAMAIAIALSAAKPLSFKSIAVTLAVVLIAALPLIEAPSVVGVFCALAALAVLSLYLAHRLPARITTLPWKLFGFALLAPFRGIEDGVQLLSRRSGTGMGRAMVRQIAIWLVPVGCALVFIWLFSSANPVIETVLARIDPSFLAQFADGDRVALWVGIAIVAWPLLMPRLLQKRRFKPAATGAALPLPEGLLFGQAAVLRSLIVFNAIFAVQTLLDITYLWGGVALPDGMSHADYAHRGAYPLIATALLAGAFVLAAMRPGGAGEKNKAIRWLVYAWIAQNIMLCMSSILRLDLYVEAYSLTELRIAAGIWMGLVAIGLALILARIALRRDNTWLIATNCLALLMTLYACAFVDFSAMIANFNVEHSREMGGDGQALDIYYLRDLGPSALPALDRLISNPAIAADYVAARKFDRADLVKTFRRRDTDWRAWSFRNWRLEQYLATPGIAVSPRSDNNSGSDSP